jgi:hypothetical protein
MKPTPIFFLLFIAFSCGENSKHAKTEVAKDSLSYSAELEEPFFEESFMVEDTLKAENNPSLLRAIQANFKEVNSVQKWDSVVHRVVFESGMEGDLSAYYLGGKLYKILVRHHDEVFQKLCEFYLKENELSMVLEKSIYFDSFNTDVNQRDSIFFVNGRKAVIEIVHSYFVERNLVHQFHSLHSNEYFTPEDFKREQKRLIDVYSILRSSLNQY